MRYGLQPIVGKYYDTFDILRLSFYLIRVISIDYEILIAIPKYSLSIIVIGFIFTRDFTVLFYVPGLQTT